MNSPLFVNLSETLYLSNLQLSTNIFYEFPFSEKSISLYFSLIFWLFSHILLYFTDSSIWNCLFRKNLQSPIGQHVQTLYLSNIQLEGTISEVCGRRNSSISEFWNLFHATFKYSTLCLSLLHSISHLDPHPRTAIPWTKQPLGKVLILFLPFLTCFLCASTFTLRSLSIFGRYITMVLFKLLFSYL